MRKQLVSTVSKALLENKKTVLLLGDIGVFGFRKAFQDFPNRVYNIGILEQATVSLAAGLSSLKFIPIIHTIAPFLVERAYEQLKIDFGYQLLGGNFITIGASYDYAGLGCTHHCPADIPILSFLPGFNLVVPGTSEEFNSLFNQIYDNSKPNYFRLSETENSSTVCKIFNKPIILKRAKSENQVTVVVIGNLLDLILNATKQLDVNIVYYNTVIPFNVLPLQQLNSKKFVICEPYYSGVVSHQILKNLKYPVRIKEIGVPINFLNKYGTKKQHDQKIGFSVQKIKNIVYELEKNEFT